MDKNSSTISQRYRKRLPNRSIEPSPQTAEGNTCDPPVKNLEASGNPPIGVAIRGVERGVLGSAHYVSGFLTDKFTTRHAQQTSRPRCARHSSFFFQPRKKCLDSTSSDDKNGQLFHIPGPLSFPQTYPHYFSSIPSLCSPRRTEEGGRNRIVNFYSAPRYLYRAIKRSQIIAVVEMFVVCVLFRFFFFGLVPAAAGSLALGKLIGHCCPVDAERFLCRAVTFPLFFIVFCVTTRSKSVTLFNSVPLTDAGHEIIIQFRSGPIPATHSKQSNSFIRIVST